MKIKSIRELKILVDTVISLQGLDAEVIGIEPGRDGFNSPYKDIFIAIRKDCDGNIRLEIT